jgi:hypothetical protein
LTSLTITRAPCARNERDEESDRPGADDERALSGAKLGPAHVVAGHRKRLDESGEPQVDGRRQVVKCEGGDGPGALEGPRPVDAEELQPAADVAVPLVGRRLGAGIERPHDDQVAHSESLDSRADLGDDAGHLVTDDLRRADALVHRAVRDVEVGAAHAAVRDVDPHLTVAGRLGHAEAEPAAAFVVHRRHHDRSYDKMI